MNKLLDKLKEQMTLRNYSKRTISQYMKYAETFYRFSCGNTMEPWDRIPCFLLEYKHSPESVSQAYHAVKLFYKFAVGKQCPYTLDKVKKTHRVPSVLDKNTILKLLSAIKNPKHKTMIAFLYASGLRVSEVVNIRAGNINLNKNLLKIKNSKAHKDRITIISETLFPEIVELLKDKKPKDYLFTTINGKKYNIRTVQAIFEHAVKAAGIKNLASCHTLRHSFATHLLEGGTDVKRIKELMGHSNLKTTLGYLHIANISEAKIKSPL
jgi:site-specific recombinase XerD